MVFHLYFSFALKRRWCWQFVLRKFEVKVFGPKGRKFLATKKFVLATKSKNLGASWPQGFFFESRALCPVLAMECPYIRSNGEVFLEKKKTSALLKNAFAFHLGAFVNLYLFERSMNLLWYFCLGGKQKSLITKHANPRYAKNVK